MTWHHGLEQPAARFGIAVERGATKFDREVVCLTDSAGLSFAMPSTSHPMSEPNALANVDEIGAADRVELASRDAFVQAHYPRLGCFVFRKLATAR